MFLSSNVKGDVHTGNMKTLSLPWCYIAHASSQESTHSLRPLPVLKLSGPNLHHLLYLIYLPYLFFLTSHQEGHQQPCLKQQLARTRSSLKQSLWSRRPVSRGCLTSKIGKECLGASLLDFCFQIPRAGCSWFNFIHLEVTRSHK